MKYFSLPLFALFGILDAGYLTYERFAHLIIPCSNSYFVDCGKVLASPYATVYGVPLALIGLIYYLVLLCESILIMRSRRPVWKYLFFIQTTTGLLASLFFMYLQLFVIHAICLYCTFSAINSLVIFIAARWVYPNEYRQWVVFLSALLYRYIVRPLFFGFPPEIIHTIMTRSGEIIGSSGLLKQLFAWFLRCPSPVLKQQISTLSFLSPVGLSAGFDYEARLTQIAPALGFGFQTVGTITNRAYEGNPLPRLGRLPKSKSLMVNKGFKNDGVNAIIRKLSKLSFSIPVGISIGKTNSPKVASLQDAITDIAHAFAKLEQSRMCHRFYELNISCPNLYGNVSFYPPKNLAQLLKIVDSLALKRPVFIKMPIEKNDTEFLAMLRVIVKHKIAGIIVGNLQKNREDRALNQDEVKRFPVGSFSGKPTEQRSNELIHLAYKKLGKKLVIIGCGGIFTPEDAYKKIKLGASLVQLITGMIYNGPQLIAQINEELVTLIKQDGYRSIHEAIGTAD